MAQSETLENLQMFLPKMYTGPTSHKRFERLLETSSLCLKKWATTSSIFYQGSSNWGLSWRGQTMAFILITVPSSISATFYPGSSKLSLSWGRPLARSGSLATETGPSPVGNLCQNTQFKRICLIAQYCQYEEKLCKPSCWLRGWSVGIPSCTTVGVFSAAIET